MGDVAYQAHNTVPGKSDKLTNTPNGAIPFFFFFKLRIFLIYISNAIPKVPHTLPHTPQAPPLPRHGPGVSLY